jgi:hypothetical protein
MDPEMRAEILTLDIDCDEVESGFGLNTQFFETWGIDPGRHKKGGKRWTDTKR